MRKIAVIMGSDSDMPVVKKAVDMLREFEVPYEVHVFSAHRTPCEAAQFAESARENGFAAIIAAAGMAAHLAGAIAAKTTLYRRAIWAALMRSCPRCRCQREYLLQQLP